MERTIINGRIPNRYSFLKQLYSFFYYKYRVRQINKDFEWYFSWKGFLSRWRLEKLRGYHWGKRCFLIGNGPSLKKMDLRPLANEYTIGLNRIYLLFDEIGFTTTYHVTINKLVVEQCAQDIAQIKAPKFISWETRDLIPFNDDMIFLRSLFHPHFSKDPMVGIWEGSTVTYAAMQVAHFLGFHEVILIGVDHNFETKGPANQEVVTEDEDPNHFAPNYFGKGFRWQLPDLYRSEIAYRLARLAFEQNNREIVDATVGGKLDVFRKANYEELLQGNKDK